MFEEHRGWKLLAGLRVAEDAFENKIKQHGVEIVNFIEGLPFFGSDVS